jgi:hypothetical protein
MTNQAPGPWQPGKGKTLEQATEQAWENAKKGHAARGFVAAEAPGGTYKLEIWIEATNPIHSYIVGLVPIGP